MEDNKERMLKIMKSLERNDEIIIETEKVVDENKILEENDRLKALISKNTNSDFKNENYYVAGNFQTGGRGQTVNTIVGNYKENETNKPQAKNQSSNLTAEEALEVCIKRTLKSGVPINSISFYDEVNWNLMNIAFPAKNEVDIKTAILNMIKE